MDNKLKELSLRAMERLRSMPSLKTAEDAKGENKDFSFLESYEYKEIISVGDSESSQSKLNLHKNLDDKLEPAGKTVKDFAYFN